MDITLIFFYLNAWDLARHRVAQRVSKGGHHIPEIDIERRYLRGIQNLPAILML
jgi:predicted ABC-type ATPase